MSMFLPDTTHFSPGSLTPIELRMNTGTSFVPSQGTNLQLDGGAARMRARLSTTVRDATGLTRPPTSAPSTPPTTPLAHDAKAADAQREARVMSLRLPCSRKDSARISEMTHGSPVIETTRRGGALSREISAKLCLRRCNRLKRTTRVSCAGGTTGTARRSCSGRVHMVLARHLHLAVVLSCPRSRP